MGSHKIRSHKKSSQDSKFNCCLNSKQASHLIKKYIYSVTNSNMSIIGLCLSNIITVSLNSILN